MMIERLYCALFNHELVVAQEITPYVRRCFCHRCRRSFAMNDRMQAFLEWDENFHDLYNNVFKIPMIYADQEVNYSTVSE